MYYGNIKTYDIANGDGVRTSIFVSGCTNHCKECFNPETWDFCYGKPFTKETEDNILSTLKPAYIAGLTILGGEPMEPKNQEALLPFVKRVKQEFPNKTIWLFSGFRLDDEILKQGAYPNTKITNELLSYIDVLVDGRFIDALKNLSLKFRGSSNQRVIDVQKTLASGNIVLYCD